MPPLYTGFMFDDLVDATTGTRGSGALSSWSRVENAACARRVATMAAMLDAAYAVSGSTDRDQWCLDNFDAVAAHIGAAQRITSGTASNQLLIAVALHERFPRVAAVFADGLITYALVKTVVQRGALVIDPDALRLLDASLAEAFGHWEPMSVDKTEKAIDGYVARVDPQAVRRTETKARSRGVEITYDEDGSGMATIYSTLFAHNAKAFEARLKALAATVCPADPRTADQLRSDAFGAVGNRNDRMACLCGSDECTAAQNPPATDVVVYVIPARTPWPTRHPTARVPRRDPRHPRRQRKPRNLPPPMLARRMTPKAPTSSPRKPTSNPTPHLEPMTLRRRATHGRPCRRLPATNAPPWMGNRRPSSTSPCAPSPSPKPSPRHRGGWPTCGLQR